VLGSGSRPPAISSDFLTTRFGRRRLATTAAGSRRPPATHHRRRHLRSSAATTTAKSLPPPPACAPIPFLLGRAFSLTIHSAGASNDSRFRAEFLVGLNSHFHSTKARTAVSVAVFADSVHYPGALTASIRSKSSGQALSVALKSRVPKKTKYSHSNLSNF